MILFNKKGGIFVNIVIIVTLVLLSACQTIPEAQREPMPQEINERSDKTISSIVAKVRVGPTIPSPQTFP